MPVLRFDPEARAILLGLHGDEGRRALFLAVKDVLVELREAQGELPRAVALRVVGGGHGYFVPVYVGDDSWAVGWKRLEDGTFGILYIGPNPL